jgi:hypothetical protein
MSDGLKDFCVHCNRINGHDSNCASPIEAAFREGRLGRTDLKSEIQALRTEKIERDEKIRNLEAESRSYKDQSEMDAGRIAVMHLENQRLRELVREAQNNWNHDAVCAMRSICVCGLTRWLNRAREVTEGK